MRSPQSTEGLMQHLINDCNIRISGDYQKKQLISYGYYHGYKGYRFFRNHNIQIPYADFAEVVAVIEYDSNLKSALYSDLMFVETALKNIVCNKAVEGLSAAAFDSVYAERMSDHPENSALQAKRLKLRNAVYSTISRRYSAEAHMENQMIRHFYNRGEDAPLWVIFEVLYMSDLADFFSCLNESVREEILQYLEMLDISIDTGRTLLSSMIYTLKALRNAVAHNSVIFDARFRDRNISTVLRKWTERETGINNITLYALIDYLILLCCLLKRLDFSDTRAESLLQRYKEQNQKLQSSVSPAVYETIARGYTAQKIRGLETYLASESR